MAADKIIIYDDTCPMCVWYTGVFVKTGLLKPENRRAFSDVAQTDLSTQIDWERARDEIPCMDQEAGITRYGVDSMLAVLGQRFPWLIRIADHPLLRWLPRLLYKIVTYNRRVMSGAVIPEHARAYGPHFNYFYRYLYLLCILACFGGVVNGLDLLANLQWLVLGLGLSPLLFTLRMTHRRALHYAGIMLSPLVLAAVLLWPAVYWPAAMPFLGVCALYVWLRMLIRRWQAAHHLA